jgi:hypothetical protein
METIPDHWCDMRPGQKVWLLGLDGVHYYGVVDDNSEDGAFVWVLTTGSGRKLFHVDDGFRAAHA